MELLLALVIIAFLLIIAGLIILSLSSKQPGERNVRGGGVLIIGPIPIIFGTDQGVAKGLALLAIILTIVVTMAFLLLRAAG